jgi:sigma-B regulation protein RsbU (phosphoserine phosphatase)
LIGVAMPNLIIYPKDSEPFTVRLDKPRTTIGRSSRNDICINDPFASRLHAEIRREGDSLLLVDLGSANGSFVGGKRINTAARLLPGDRIRIGETEILYQAEDQTIAQPTVLLSGSSAALPTDTITSTGSRTTSDLIASIRSGAFLSTETQGTAVQMAPITTVSGALPEESLRTSPTPNLLGIVSKVGIALLPRTSLEETLKITIDLVFEAIPAERGFLLLKEDGELRCKIARSARPTTAPVTSQIQISRSISSKVLNEGASILTSDATHDPRFQSQQSVLLSPVRSVMAVPLASGEEIFGMIYVDNPLHNRFTENHLDVLTTIASVASIKIENERLLEERLEKRRMEEELKVASEIQMRLLPVAPPRIEGWDMTGVSFPCREVGGDYYDFIQRKKDSRIIVTLGDVSGKGTGAAILMSSLHAAVRAQSQTGSPICNVMSEINQYLYENTPPNKFVTLFYGELDPQSATLRYSNAGHNPPILVRRSGQLLRLDIGGLPIGIMPTAAYSESSITFQPGDVLVIYSDGISESINTDGEEFGEQRLIEVVQQNLNRSASGIRDRIDEALSRFVGNAPPVDDMTLMIIKRSDSHSPGL